MRSSLRACGQKSCEEQNTAVEAQQRCQSTEHPRQRPSVLLPSQSDNELVADDDARSSFPYRDCAVLAAPVVVKRQRPILPPKTAGVLRRPCLRLGDIISGYPEGSVEIAIAWGSQRTKYKQLSSYEAAVAFFLPLSHCQATPLPPHPTETAKATATHRSRCDA